MQFTARMAAVVLLVGALALTATGCGASTPSLDPMTTAPSVPDIVGSTLDDAWASLTEAGFTVDANDVRENRSVWDRGNWVVLTQTVSGQTVTLEVEKADDPACWGGAATCEWVLVLTFDSTGDAESEQFTLDGAPARLSYSVAAATITEGMRTADIYFQDWRSTPNPATSTPSSTSMSRVMASKSSEKGTEPSTSPRTSEKPTSAE